MASVAELLAAVEARNAAKKSPLVSLIEQGLSGYDQGQAVRSRNLDNNIKLLQIQQARQQMAAQAQMAAEVQAQIKRSQEAKVTQDIKNAKTPEAVLPSQKFQQKIKQDEKGNYSRSFEVVEQESATPTSYEAVLADKYNRGKISLEEFARLRSQGTSYSQAKPPLGFRFTTDGNLEAIPGGPADIKGQQAAKKEKGLKDAATAQAQTVIATIDSALDKVGSNTAGLGGSIMSRVPGSEAVNLESDIDTIKANLGFATLQEMRRNSPTGGALGQVAVQELNMLQSTVASLNTKQSPPQLKKKLEAVKTHYQNWLNTVDKSMGAMDGGEVKKTAEERFDELVSGGTDENEAYRILAQEGY